MLEKSDVKIIVITPAPVWAVKRFIEEHDFKLPMYSDPKRQLYSTLGMKLKFDSQLEWRVASPHVSTSVPMAWVKGFYLGVTQGMQGDPRQQGGSFILGPGDKCSFSHYDAFNADHVIIPDLLAAAGVDQNAFHFKDKAK